MKKIQSIFDLFGVEYYECDERLTGCCPVHHGDNHTAFNINIEEDNEDHYGRWFCNTHACHEEKPGKDILSLLWMLLEDRENKELEFPEVLRFAEKLCADVEIDENISFKKLDPIEKLLKKKAKAKSTSTITREQVRNSLKFPAQYYLNRGYTERALDHFDVGFCDNPNAQMYNRVVFPVYDEKEEFMVGCVGRTVTDDPRKWINQKKFNKSNYLFNYGRASKHIQRTGSIILVEGQGDVIRLYEAGIENAVGIFGSKLSDSQEFLIQKTGVSNIIIMTDSDEAGESCAKDISRRLEFLFNIIRVKIPGNDIGEMTVEDISEIIKPQIEGMY